MESSVMSSWITEASLSVQALARKARKPLAPKNKLADTKEVRGGVLLPRNCYHGNGGIQNVLFHEFFKN